MTVKVLVADPAWMVRASVTQLVLDATSEAEVIQACDDNGLLQALAENPDLDLVLIDDGFVADDACSLFLHVPKSAYVGVLTAVPDRERVLNAIRHGAVAVIPKTEDRETLTAAIKLVLGGHCFYPRAVIAIGRSAGQQTVESQFERLPEDNDLTRREREVLVMLGGGRSVARIADELRLSPHTVRVHLTRITKKLDMRDRPSLMHYAVQLQQDDTRARKGRA